MYIVGKRNRGMQQVNSRRSKKENCRSLPETRGVFAPCFLLLVTLVMPPVSAAAQQSGRQIFESQCTPCHTIGGGKSVGPDLVGVTSRRDGEWLRRQIKEPDKLIAEKDPIALQLLKEANNVPMVPLGLSDAQVTDVVEFLKSTEQETKIQTGLPSRYLPTLVVSALVLVALTLVGLRAGKKHVDVR